jgi:hypothetical protein
MKLTIHRRPLLSDDSSPMSPSESFSRFRRHFGEVRVQRVDDLTFAEVAHAEQFAGRPALDQRRRVSGGAAERHCEFEARVAVDLGLLAGGQVEPHQPGAVATPVGADPHAGAVRSDLHRHHTHRVVRAVPRRHRAQLAGRGVPAGDLEVAILGERGGEQLAVAARQPALSGTGALGQHREFAGGDVEFVQVDLGHVPGVEMHDRLPGPPVGHVEGEHPRPRKRRQVDRRGVRIVQVDPVDVVVLVAARVLQVEQPARIVGPLVAQHAAGLVRGHAARVGVGVEVLDPDVEPVLPRRQVGDPGSVRRDRRARAIGWSEEVLNRDDVG